jgi:hypothetical protein
MSRQVSLGSVALASVALPRILRLALGHLFGSMNEWVRDTAHQR